jgi:hypothetical protein
MGLAMATVQNTLELYNLGYFKKAESVMEIGSQELHLKKNDLKELFDYVNLDSSLVENYPNIDNWPNQPRCSSKYLYEALGFKEYASIDINSELGAINHDLNKPFEDKSKFGKYDLVTDHGSCEHVFNVPECYKTIHNLTKPGDYIVSAQQIIKGNGYFLFDKSIIDGMAAANNYKIIFASYTLTAKTTTKKGSAHQFHVPLSEFMFDTIDFGKIDGLGVYAVFQKQNDSEYKFPYQSGLMNEIFNCSGFNRLYFKDQMAYSYVPSAKLTYEEAPFKILVKEFFKRLLKKLKKI